MATSLSYLNTCPPADFVQALHGIYEHSPWIPERAASARPFATLAALKQALQAAVTNASADEQLGLIRAHPELAGKAAIAGRLTAESTSEQAKSGLNQCSPEEFATLQQLNADYNAKFGFPFILAVKGPTGQGLTRQAIIATFARRLKNARGAEVAECLRQIHRIAEMRLNDLLGVQLAYGPAIMQWAEELAQWSDDADGLTCAYMTDAHRKTAARLAEWMREAGMQVTIDAVGNVVGRYPSDVPGAKTLITGSHYDTVRNGGKYDGRQGILLPLAIVRDLHARGEKLPFHLEVIGFAEEEGVRYRSTFLGSNAVTGRFDVSLLDAVDADGVTMRAALQAAGHDTNAIAGIARNADDVLAYVEVHIEQGPVLLERGLPLGVVTAIAGSSRYLVELTGVASHAGTTPMAMRKDAAAAAAEIVLLVEQRCGRQPALVGTVGQLAVPNGSVNVVPGACRLSLDIRAAEDAVRLAAVKDVLDGIAAICTRRGIEYALEPIVQAPAAPCAPWLMDQLGAAVERSGLPRFDLLSGAGHDAMAMAALTDVAMLFTRCGNGGISHNPLETMTADDADIAATVLLDFLRRFTRR
ncbi:allantoate deiminase/N-carbamoyl-L-amino-acid hydrolase [Pseudoduganella flava]|uniref:Allantoate amidohydrolase n=1 Tax=Pseudoduganella flava TaxID=871742 RepID=A0A562Q3L4_9BURK|nr:allantoate amidohydrolase [Pseudoduganella flava]QGZ41395.1 allantoate amidohydrolase [Pseudoduganella flava]TWI51347.1 allantoate deiminase/N-carbamoyl-L-amino-acid hydrolase [Pseudoduganella flava]